jgi:hypothetical protein
LHNKKYPSLHNQNYSHNPHSISHVSFVSRMNSLELTTSPCNRHQLKTMYRKFLPKTQSLDIVDENAISNLDDHACFESINEELMTDSSEDLSAKAIASRFVAHDHGHIHSQSRPIFPNLTYSPYSSPRISRKPAKESRRISIDKNGSFIQLNQYKLMDQIGVVSKFISTFVAVF